MHLEEVEVWCGKTTGDAACMLFAENGWSIGGASWEEEAGHPAAYLLST